MASDFKARTEELYRLLANTKNADRQRNLRNQIIELNIRLVPHVLKKYRPYSDDNFQNGCIGLIQAADTYQMTRGVPFSSYACFCIERAIQLAFKKQQQAIEAILTEDAWIRLDATVYLSNGDQSENQELIWDEKASAEMEKFIADNELEFICTNIIKPSIADISNRGKHMKVKVDTDLWEKLEFAYIIDLIFIDSQKQRFNLTQLAKSVGLSIQNVRMRHKRVMEVIFQRMWDYMTLSYEEIFERLRNRHKVPERLLCLDPGKTTGWCVFEKGKLVATGHIEDCYETTTINFMKLATLFEDIKPTHILYEDYKIYTNKLNQHSNSPVFTLRLIGAIEAYAQQNNIKTFKQMATVAKGFVTDEKLKQWGFWATGLKHARDAIRHGCYFLLFYKRGQDIV